MAFFIGLLLITSLIWVVSRLLHKGPFQEFWVAARVGTSLMFVQVGIMHLVKPEALTYMIEGLLPYPVALVIISGITEILFGLGLLWPPTRRWAAWLLIIQLIMMFPANINVAIHDLSAPGGLPAASWYTWSRLAFQPLYIWWVYKASVAGANPVRTKTALV